MSVGNGRTVLIMKQILTLPQALKWRLVEITGWERCRNPSSRGGCRLHRLFREYTVFNNSEQSSRIVKHTNSGLSGMEAEYYEHASGTSRNGKTWLVDMKNGNGLHGRLLISISKDRNALNSTCSTRLAHLDLLISICSPLLPLLVDHEATHARGEVQ